MGVSGCGKSSVGNALAKTINLPFFDADDYHPEANILKMKQGIPLKDEDRYPWLKILNELIKSRENEGLVLACSALKDKYRRLLENHLSKKVHWIFLSGSKALILERINQRSGHFMPIDLLNSQFEALEFPEEAIEIDIKPNAIDRKIILTGYLIVGINFLIVFIFYWKIPDIIPTHFDASGKANGFSEKLDLFGLPIFSLILYYGMSMVATKIKPYYYNYPIRVTEKSAPEIYSLSIRMMVILNLSIAMVFTFLTSEIILGVFDGSNNIGVAFLPISMCAIFGCIIYYLLKMFKTPK